MRLAVVPVSSRVAIISCSALRRCLPVLLCVLSPGAWAQSPGTAGNVLPFIAAILAGIIALGIIFTLLARLHELRAQLRDKDADLVRSAHEWNHAMDFLEDPMYLVDLQDRLVRANKAFYRQIGKTPEESLGLDVRSLIHLKPEKTPCPACAARLEHRDAFFTKEANDPTNPTGRPIEVTVRVIRDETGRPLGVLQGLRDLSHLRAAEEALYREKERAQVTLNAIGDAVLTTDAKGALDYLNPAAEQLLGVKTSDVAGRFYDEVLQMVDETSRLPVADPVIRCLGRKAAVAVDEQSLLIDAKGNEYAVDVVAAPILDSAGARIGAVLAMHDVSAIRGITRRLNYQATHDALTGLINRREFEVRLRQVMESAQVDNSRHSLIFMDLDRFKIVNDTCGHAAGDALLTEVADLLASQLRNVDTLARIGGDEFALLLECCPIDTAERIGKQLVDKVMDYRLNWEDKSFEIGVSMGLVEITADSRSITELMGDADDACYAAKRAGRNRIYRYEADDQNLLKHQGQAQWVHRINQALEQDRFVLYCQGIQKLGVPGQPIRHYEILVRMLDEAGQVVPPNDFIPAAERYELMPAVDRWVVAKSIETLRLGGSQLQQDTVWSINLSGQSLGDEQFLDFVLHAVDSSEVNPSALCFEITETAAVASFMQARRFIKALRDRGVHFALDDFGSGMSSFAYLKNLQVDYLKIDGEFVREMAEDALSFSLVRSIQQVGQAMGIHTIAEFVENEAIIHKLNELKVDFGQGYGIERPRPLDGFISEQRQKRRVG